MARSMRDLRACLLGAQVTAARALEDPVEPLLRERESLYIELLYIELLYIELLDNPPPRAHSPLCSPVRSRCFLPSKMAAASALENAPPSYS